MTATRAALSRCPRCEHPLEFDALQPGWCPECEWNLETRSYPADRPLPGRFARRGRDRAFEMNRRLVRTLAWDGPGRPRGTITRRVLTAASLLFLLLDLGLVAVGAYLVVTGTVMIRVAGLVLFLIGIECRVRVPQVRHDGHELRPADAPNLFAVIERARAAVGAPPVDTVVIDDKFNAFCVRTGLRRRVVLGLGAPLWGSLSPAARMAVLGHELGHLVNGDPTTSLTTKPALLTCGRLADLFDPHRIVAGVTPRIRTWGEMLATPAAYLLLPVHLVFNWLHLWLQRVGARDHQRAETYADALAVELAGSAATKEVMRALVFERDVRAAVQRSVVQGADDPAVWRAAAARTLAKLAPRTRHAEQVSLRMEASAYGSHPPAGMRLRLVSSWPAVRGRLAVPLAELDAADDELRDAYRDVRRSLQRRVNF